VKKIGIYVTPKKKACDKADELESWLTSKDFHIIRKNCRLPDFNRTDQKQTHAPSDLFCVFVLGGDGTFLSAVRWIGDHQIPIIGIKFGEVGFLAEASEDSLFDVAQAVVRGSFSIKPRMRLLVKVLRDNKEIARETVLNDVVINRGTLARLAPLKTYIDDHYLTTFRADGLIISTPTGSTAYSLAAGGPVVHPDVPGIVITPICPFTLTNRPLIVPESVSIKIILEKKVSDIMLTFDGQKGLELNETDTIMTTRGRHPVQMITIPHQDYFDILKAKLRWSGERV
jgi:NAD+ kinase